MRVFLLVGVLVLLTMPTMAQDQELITILQEFEASFNEIETGLDKLETGLTTLKRGQAASVTALNEAERQLNDLENTFIEHQVKTQNQIDNLSSQNKTLRIWAVGSTVVLFIGLIIAFIT